MEWPLEQESGMGSDEKKIIAKVAEMCHATFAGGRIAHGGGDINAAQASPSEPNGQHRIEVESPSGPAAGEYS